MRKRAYKLTENNFVKREMAKRKLTYDQLAKLTGIPKSTLVETIYSLDRPTKYMLKRSANLWEICKTLDINMWKELAKIKNKK